MLNQQVVCSLGGMQRREMSKGDELYYDPSPTWEYSPSDQAAKVIVVDAEKGWKLNPEWGAWGVTEMFVAAPRARGVLVEIDGERALVQPIHLRGPYAETAERVARRTEEYNANLRAMSRRLSAQQVMRQRVEERLRWLSRTENDDPLRPVRWTVTVPSELLLALLEHAEGHGQRWDREELIERYDAVLDAVKDHELSI